MIDLDGFEGPRTWRGVLTIYVAIVRAAWSLSRVAASEIGIRAYAGVVLLVGVPLLVVLAVVLVVFAIVRAPHLAISAGIIGGSVVAAIAISRRRR